MRIAESGMSGPESKSWNGRVPPDVPEAWNKLAETVIGCAMEVHSTLGPGLLERLYEEAMSFELRERGIPFARQVPVILRYKSIDLSGQRLDLVIGGLVVVELKAVEAVPDIALAQLTSSLRSAHLPLGLLLNFNVPRLRDGIFRRINPAAVLDRSSSATEILSSL